MNELQRLSSGSPTRLPSATPDRLRVRVAAIPVDVRKGAGWGALPALTMRLTTLRLPLVARCRRRCCSR